jgi:hypothetical protein
LRRLYILAQFVAPLSTGNAPQPANPLDYQRVWSSIFSGPIRVEIAMANDISSIRIKLGQLEVDYQGDAQFLKEDLLEHVAIKADCIRNGACSWRILPG